MTLQAGAATRDISPTQPTALYGYPHVERISTGIHDPLRASALYLGRGPKGVVLVALDLLFLDPPTARALRRKVAQKAGLPEARVLISCTHTHSGPVTAKLLSWQEDPTIPDPDPAYLQWVEQRVVEAVAEAKHAARAASLAWTTADARGVGGNRHALDGPTDPEVGILAVRDAGNGGLMAAALVYGMHPTVLHEDSTLVSSDFPHYTRELLREHFGQQLVVVYHTAPAGNQSPRYHVDGQTFDEARRLGRELGASVAESLAVLLDEEPTNRFTDAPELAGALIEVTLPRRAMPPLAEAQTLLDAYRAEYKRLQAEGAERPKVRTAECAIFGAEETVALARARQSGQIDETLRDYAPIEVQALKIGGTCLVGVPGELFTEYALELKRRSPVPVHIASLTGGELQGYIVTPEAEAAGGYEATNALFAPEAGNVMINAALKLLEAWE